MGKTFKPEEFGFNMSYSKRAAGGAAVRGCYVTMDEPKKKLQLVIDVATTERLREIAGDRVSFGMDKKGRILVTSADGAFGRKLSKASSHLADLAAGLHVRRLQVVHGHLQAPLPDR